MKQDFDLPVIAFESQEEFRAWLKKHHTQDQGIWLKFYKKDSGVESINYAQALDEALCFGWIDGQLRKFDDKAYVQRFTPRRPRSIWSKRNIEHIQRLIKEKKMQPAGLAQFEAAKADGRLARAYDPQSKFRMPQDFLNELAKYPKAEEFYRTLNRGNQFAIFYQLQDAKKPETRERRLQKILKLLQEGQKLF